MLNCFRSLAAGALALCLLAVPSLAQQGLLTPGQVMGNAGASNAVPRGVSVSALFNQALCTTTGAFPVRAASGWQCSTAANTPAALPTGGITMSGNPPISTTFAGNGLPGLLWVDAPATANSATANEWVAQFTISSSTGGANQATATKGGLFADCIANAGSGDCYGANFIGQASSGLETKINVTSLEVDQNNNNSDRPSTCFEYNCSPGVGQYWGLTLAHGSTFKSSAAIYITDLTGGGRWQRAIAIGASAGSKAVIEDISVSTTGWLMTGTKTTALDFSGATLTNAMLLPNNAAIYEADSGGTQRALLVMSASNTINIGDAVHSIFLASAAGLSLAPTTNNQMALGGTSARFSTIYGIHANFGAIGVGTGDISLLGTTSGTAIIKPQDAAGTPTITLGTSSGTPVVTASSPLSITTATGNLTWAGLTSGGVIYAASTTSVASSALLTANQIVLGGGAGTAPASLGSLGTTTTVLHGNAAGNPSFAAVSLTADVSGVLPLANGGSNANLTASTGGIVYSSVSAMAILSGTATASFPLLSGASAAPTWATITYPTSATSGGVPYFSSATAISSSGVLASTAIMLGGGAGAAPTTSACTISSDINISCSTSSSFRPAFFIQNTTADANPPNVNFAKGRSSSSGAVTTGDYLGAFYFTGGNGSTSTNSGFVAAQVGAALSGNNIPTNIVFIGSNAAGVQNQTFTFDYRAHMLILQATAPTLTAGCNGTGSAITTGSTDMAGEFTTQNTGTTTCTVTFGQAYTAAPKCTASGSSDTTTGTIAVVPTASTIVFTYSSVTSKKIMWVCGPANA